jgi:hypothetical protein
VHVFIFAVVRQITGEEHEVWTLRQSGDQLHCTFECFGAQWIGRAVETYMRIAELNETEGRNFLAGIFTEKLNMSPLSPLAEAAGKAE